MKTIKNITTGWTHCERC